MKETTIKWYKPSDNMPSDDTYNVLAYSGGMVANLQYNPKLKLFNSSVADNGKHAFSVDYWAYVSDIKALYEVSYDNASL